MFRSHLLTSIILSVGFVALSTHSAFAYIGPSAGAGAFAILIAVVAGLALLVVGLVWYPLKRLLKKKNTSQDTASTSDHQE